MTLALAPLDLTVQGAEVGMEATGGEDHREGEDEEGFHEERERWGSRRQRTLA
jgi:hypothetical protein